MHWPDDNPGAGDFSGIEDMARQLRNAREWLANVVENNSSIPRWLSSGWQGPAADAFLTTNSAVVNNAGMFHEDVDVLCRATRSYLSAVPETITPEVKTLRWHRKQAVDELAEVRKRYAADLLLDPSLGTYLSADARRIRDLEGDIEYDDARMVEWCQARREADARFASACANADFAVKQVTIGSVSAPAFGGGAGGPAPEPIPVFWYFTDITKVTPEEIRAQWDQLTDAQRWALIGDRHHQLGNLEGIPLAWRCRANDLNIADEIDRLKAKRDAIGKNTPNLFLLPDPYAHRAALTVPAEERAKLDARIAYLESLLDRTDPDWTRRYDQNGKELPNLGKSQVVVFDPANEAIAIYHGVFDENGDIPSWYANTALYVPGTGTKIVKFGTPDLRAAEMYEAANGPGRPPTAVIVWSGGPQPQLADAILSRYAQDMGPKLRDFANTNIPEATTFTVIGHSYGATTVAQAEAVGLEADRVLYVAPAGYGEGPSSYAGRPQGKFIRGLEDFPNTGDAPHYAMLARKDPIVGLAQNDLANIHGGTPVTDPEVTRLETGYLDASEPALGFIDENSDSHSTVFNKESTSFANIVAVITGGTAEGYGGHEQYEVLPAEPVEPNELPFCTSTPTLTPPPPAFPAQPPEFGRRVP